MRHSAVMTLDTLQWLVALIYIVRDDLAIMSTNSAYTVVR